MSESKKKIVVIENHALATNTIRRNLMQAIMDEGYELTIITGSGEIFDKLSSEGFQMVDCGTATNSPFSIPSYLWKLRRLLIKVDPDVCLTFTIRPAIYGNLITRMLKISTVSNITGIGPLFENNGLNYRIARFLYPHALKRTKKVFFQNFDDLEIFEEKKYIKGGVAERIPGSGIDYNKFSPRPSPRRDDVVRFLFIGRLLVDKGVLEYVEAAKDIMRKYKSVEFHIVGPLWNLNLKSNSITKATLNSWIDQDKLIYHGETDDVRPYISESDCIVLPSYREGTSNVLLEGASMSKPLIATNVTGCKEIIDDNITGFLCQVRDSGDLSKKMEKLIMLSEKERIEMGENGRKKVIREYSKKMVIDAYLRSIDKLTK